MLMEAADLGTKTKTVSKMLKDKTDTSLLLHMLSLVFHPKSRVLVLEKLKASSETGHIICLYSSSLQIIKQRL